MTVDPRVVEEIVGELALPCDFSDEPVCLDEPAAWVLHRVPCCEAKLTAALACETCKEHRLMNSFSLECPHCGVIFDAAPDAYFLIEPLNRRA